MEVFVLASRRLRLPVPHYYFFEFKIRARATVFFDCLENDITRGVYSGGKCTVNTIRTREIL